MELVVCSDEARNLVLKELDVLVYPFQNLGRVVIRVMHNFEGNFS